MSRKGGVQGFTIVELLIVIVVIAVLASISLVAYSGIQQRAKNTARIAEVRKVKSFLEQYIAINGSDALRIAMPAYGSYCIGEGYVDLDPGPGVSCDVYQDTYDNIPSYTRGLPALDNALKPLGNYSTGFPPIEVKGTYVDSGTTYLWTERQTAPLIDPLYYIAPPSFSISFLDDGQQIFIRLNYMLEGEGADCGLPKVLVYVGYYNGAYNYTSSSGAKNSGSGDGYTSCMVHIPKG